MTVIRFCGTPKQASTVQRVRSTESYASVRSIKHTYSGIRFFHASSCNRRITNIISVVERFGRETPCSSGRIPTRSQYSLRQRAMIFSSILPACATSVMPYSYRTLPDHFFMEYHDDTIFPLLRHLAPPSNTNDDIEQSPAQGRITVVGDLEQPDGGPVWPDSLSVPQRVDGVCQLLHRGLNS